MKHLEKIEKYVHGELEEGDLWEFKKALEIDAQLAKELKQYLSIQSALEQTDKLDFMATLNEIHQENKDKGKQRFLTPRRIATIAASVLILIAFGVGMLLMQTGNSRNSLFERYYITESGAFNVRSGANGIDQPVLQGMQFYESHDYDAALELFNQAPNNLMGRLYSGLSKIELGEFEKAIFDFDFIINHNDNLFVDQAEWYIALCYLKTNSSEEAIAYFEKIANDRSIYKTKAQKILTEMKNK